MKAILKCWPFAAGAAVWLVVLVFVLEIIGPGWVGGPLMAADGQQVGDLTVTPSPYSITGPDGKTHTTNSVRVTPPLGCTPGKTNYNCAASVTQPGQLDCSTVLHIFIPFKCADGRSFTVEETFTGSSGPPIVEELHQ